jgi:glycosyltransferase involved in cell wall biosynthesis
MPISIVMPTYNRLEFLKEAIGSVLAQSYSDWELLISDDGSNDGTRDYLSSLTDPRIRVYFQAKNQGQFGNLNFLFAKATHNISQILCDDDYFCDRDALQRLVDEWSRLPEEIAFLRSNHAADINSTLTRLQCSVLPQIVRPNQSDLFFGIFGCIAGNLSNVSVRTATVRALGGFRPDLPYAGDFEFWARLGRQYPWFVSRIRVTDVRSHEGQVGSMRNNKGEAISQLRIILEPVYSNLVKQGYPPGLIRLMFTINYISQHRYRGLRTLVRGGGPDYLKEVVAEFDSSNFSFGAVPGWLIFFGSMGGKLFRIPIAKRLIRYAPAV